MVDYHKGKHITAYLPPDVYANLALLPGATHRERITAAVALAVAAQQPTASTPTPRDPTRPGVPATLEYVASWKIANKRRMAAMLAQDAQANGWSIDAADE